MKRKRRLLVGRPLPELRESKSGNYGGARYLKRNGLREDQEQFYMYHERLNAKSISFIDQNKLTKLTHKQ